MKRDSIDDIGGEKVQGIQVGIGEERQGMKMERKNNGKEIKRADIKLQI